MPEEALFTLDHLRTFANSFETIPELKPRTLTQITQPFEPPSWTRPALDLQRLHTDQGYQANLEKLLVFLALAFQLGITGEPLSFPLAETAKPTLSLKLQVLDYLSIVKQTTITACSTLMRSDKTIPEEERENAHFFLTLLDGFYKNVTAACKKAIGQDLSVAPAPLEALQKACQISSE